jgi:hypothetical protein
MYYYSVEFLIDPRIIMHAAFPIKCMPVFLCSDKILQARMVEQHNIKNKTILINWFRCFRVGWYYYIFSRHRYTARELYSRACTINLNVRIMIIPTVPILHLIPNLRTGIIPYRVSLKKYYFDAGWNIWSVRTACREAG